MSRLLQYLLPSVTWKIPGPGKTLYLTFDDGPIPEVTPWVLDTLKQFQAKATFFCIGDNSRKHPGVMKLLIDSGHAIGNHTMHHLNGWKTPNEKYYSDVLECESLFKTKLFRPPYGKIKYKQVRFLKNNFRIIMWDVLSKDYDVSLNGQQCFERIRNNTVNGSIIVFHDSLKAEKRLRYALPETLKYFSEKGYVFSSIK
jgi:peptidoglycan/xylan/chitin deacetylase (PgdA/CDA1 family)